MKPDRVNRPDEWMKVAVEIFKEAAEGRHVEDFVRMARLRPFAIAGSSSYRLDVLGELLRLGLICKQDGYLLLPKTVSIDWLVDGLVNGEPEAWEISSILEEQSVITPRVFDHETLNRIGRDGEIFVIDELKSNLPDNVHEDIVHVSRTDDTVGYDVYTRSTKDIDAFLKIEVKTSVQPLKRGFTFFLSRNEFEVSQKSESWVLVAVNIKGGRASILGHLRGHEIAPLIPIDVDNCCSWQTLKIKLSPEAFSIGLP